MKTEEEVDDFLWDIFGEPEVKRLDENKIVMVKAGNLKVGDEIVYYKRDYQGPQFTSPVTFIAHRGSWVYVSTKQDETGGWQPYNDPVEVYKE